MQNDLRITMEDFGGRIASVWAGLRPTTRGLVARALLTAAATTSANVSAATTTTTVASARTSNIPYDARAEQELSRLLAALDERAPDGEALSAEQSERLRRMADACAAVLQFRAQSAESFSQLLAREFHVHDYAQIDLLADRISAQLPPSEICELARHTEVRVRAIAQEALTQSPTSVLVELLSDPVDAPIVRAALERQAMDYELEEARWIVNALDEAEVETSED